VSFSFKSDRLNTDAGFLYRNQYSLHARSTRIDFDDIPDVEREPSLEFTALDRDRGLDESFLDDEDSDSEQGRL
jgi:hypothetical protein